jgi:hypothetical protein
MSMLMLAGALLVCLTVVLLWLESSDRSDDDE